MAYRHGWWQGVVVMVCLAVTGCAATAADSTIDSDAVVRETFLPLMAEYDVPGLAVAWSLNGEDHFHEFGVADQATRQAVSSETLFEIGSVSKLFVAAAATLAEERGILSLNDPVEAHIAELAGTPFGTVPLLHLATHTAGGFPLQVPAGIDTEAALLAYLKAWEPEYALGARRHYANPSIGYLGKVLAQASGQDFVTLMEDGLFADMGLDQTFIEVPPEKMPAYAWGHNRDGEPDRVGERILGNEAFGVKTSSADLLRFLTLSLSEDDSVLSRALRRTHMGFFDVGPFVQALIWERYTYPLDACDLQAGNSRSLVVSPMPVQALAVPDGSRDGVALGKTGAMRGFGAYVIVVPEARFTMLVLANKNFPGSARVDAVYRAMSRLLGTPGTACSE